MRIRPEEEVASPPLEPPATDPPNSAALTEKVLLRDGLVCSVPGCRRKVGLQADHTHARSEGGRTELATEGALCDRHHAMKTEGRLKVRQGENGKRVYERRIDNLTEALLEEAERELEALPRVIGLEVSTRLDSGIASQEAAGMVDRLTPVLEELGFGKLEARRRIEGAIAALRGSEARVTEEEVLRRAASRRGRRRPA